MNFDEAAIERYARHLMLPQIGARGQQRLAGAAVAVVGAGGLGSPLLLYLAAAGGGRLTVSNLQRQVIFDSPAIGAPKAEQAARRVSALNPDVAVTARTERLTADNARALLAGHDLVADGSDNFDTRYAVNSACVALRVPLISAALLRFEGQLATFAPHRGALPCYRCLYDSPPPADTIPACAEAGIIGALPGVMGSLQAMEAIKEIAGIGESLAGWLLIYDALATEFRRVRLSPDPACPDCSEDRGAGERH